MACPLQAKFASLEGGYTRQNARATFGSCVHYALETYNRTASVEEAQTAFKIVWSHPEKIGAEPDFWPKYMTFGGYRERGLTLIKEYHERVRWEKRDVVAEEHRFLVPFGDHELEGTVDLVEGRVNAKGTPLLRIVDYKTNSYAPRKEALLANTQFTTYIYASMQPEFWFGNGDGFPPMGNAEWLFERYKDVPRRGIWYHLNTNKELDAGERTDQDFMRLYRVVQEIEKSIAADVFVPNISGDTCVFCDFHEKCGITIPTPAEALDDDAAWV